MKRFIFLITFSIAVLGLFLGHANAQGGIVGCRTTKYRQATGMVVGEVSPMQGWQCQSDGCLHNIHDGRKRCYGAIYANTPQQAAPLTAQQQPLPTSPPPPRTSPLPQQPTPPVIITVTPPSAQRQWRKFQLSMPPGTTLMPDGLWMNTGQPVLPPRELVDPCSTPVSMVSRTNGEIYHWSCVSQNWEWGTVANGSFWTYGVVEMNSQIVRKSDTDKNTNSPRLEDRANTNTAAQAKIPIGLVGFLALIAIVVILIAVIHHYQPQGG